MFKQRGGDNCDPAVVSQNTTDIKQIRSTINKIQERITDPSYRYTQTQNIKQSAYDIIQLDTIVNTNVDITLQKGGIMNILKDMDQGELNKYTEILSKLNENDPLKIKINKIDELLNNKESLFNILLEIGNSLLDQGGNLDNLIMRWNSIASKITGVSPENFVPFNNVSGSTSSVQLQSPDINGLIKEILDKIRINEQEPNSGLEDYLVINYGISRNIEEKTFITTISKILNFINDKNPVELPSIENQNPITNELIKLLEEVPDTFLNPELLEQEYNFSLFGEDYGGKRRKNKKIRKMSGGKSPDNGMTEEEVAAAVAKFEMQKSNEKFNSKVTSLFGENMIKYIENIQKMENTFNTKNHFDYNKIIGNISRVSNYFSDQRLVKYKEQKQNIEKLESSRCISVEAGSNGNSLYNTKEGIRPSGCSIPCSETGKSDETTEQGNKSKVQWNGTNVSIIQVDREEPKYTIKLPTGETKKVRSQEISIRNKRNKSRPCLKNALSEKGSIITVSLDDVTAKINSLRKNIEDAENRWNTKATPDQLAPYKNELQMLITYQKENEIEIINNQIEASFIFNGRYEANKESLQIAYESDVLGIKERSDIDINHFQENANNSKRLIDNSFDKIKRNLMREIKEDLEGLEETEIASIQSSVLNDLNSDQLEQTLLQLSNDKWIKILEESGISFTFTISEETSQRDQSTFDNAKGSKIEEIMDEVERLIFKLNQTKEHRDSNENINRQGMDNMLSAIKNYLDYKKNIYEGKQNNLRDLFQQSRLENLKDQIKDMTLQMLKSGRDEKISQNIRDLIEKGMQDERESLTSIMIYEKKNYRAPDETFDQGDEEEINLYIAPENIENILRNKGKKIATGSKGCVNNYDCIETSTICDQNSTCVSYNPDERRRYQQGEIQNSRIQSSAAARSQVANREPSGRGDIVPRGSPCYVDEQGSDNCEAENKCVGPAANGFDGKCEYVGGKKSLKRKIHKNSMRINKNKRKITKKKIQKRKSISRKY